MLYVGALLTSWGSISHFIFSAFETGYAFKYSISFSNFNVFAVLLIISFGSFAIIMIRDTVKGIAGTYIYRYADSIVEALVHCASLVIATLMISIILGKKITYPFVDTGLVAFIERFHLLSRL